ncbi:MAG: AsmA family protein [Proteobacteria bacterium]|nr:AsmA family protein [Pseudomonadota bacterium]
MIKKILKFLVVLVVLFLLISVLVITLVDINQYKDEISQFVKDETGLSLEIEGDLYLSIFSGVKINANDIRLSHNNNVIAYIDKIILGTSLASLYHEKPEIDSLEVGLKQLSLIRNKQGVYEFLPSSEETPNSSTEVNNIKLAEHFFLQHLAIKNIQLSIGKFQFLDKSNALSIKLESLKASLSLLQVIDNYELVLDDPRFLVDYDYSGNISATKALVNQYHASDVTISLNAQKGHITADEFLFHLIEQSKGKAPKKLDLSGQGKLKVSMDFPIPKGAFEPLWSQPLTIKLSDINFDLAEFLFVQQEFRLNMKKSHLLMDELFIFEKNKYVLKNLLLKPVVFKSEQIDISANSKDKYYLKQSVLKVSNLAILNNSKVVDPLSHKALKKFAQNSYINLSIASIAENKELGISNFKVDLKGKDKKITLSNLSFNAIDSKINAQGMLSLQKKVPLWELKILSDKLNLKPLSELLNMPAEPEGYIAINNNLSGTLENSDFKINNGRVHAKGNNIAINGMDLDKILNDFQSSQSVGLLDVGAVALLGPAGIALSKGNDYTKLVHSLGKGGKSKITQLNSDISFANDIASMDDVSFTTGEHQLVIKGQINLLDESFIDFKVATVDKYGCPIYKEEVKGSLSSPMTKTTNILVGGVVNPLKSVYSKLTSPIKSQCKDPFYNGILKMN